MNRARFCIQRGAAVQSQAAWGHCARLCSLRGKVPERPVAFNNLSWHILCDMSTCPATRGVATYHRRGPVRRAPSRRSCPSLQLQYTAATVSWTKTAVCMKPPALFRCWRVRALARPRSTLCVRERARPRGDVVNGSAANGRAGGHGEQAGKRSRGACDPTFPGH